MSLVFLNSYDICVCVVNKQFELLEFVFESVYVDCSMVRFLCTKRIQPARGWCATVKKDCANCIHLILPLRRPWPPVFLGSQSCDPAAWLAERQLFAGDIESNPGPKPTLKPFYTHSLSPPHSLNPLIHQSNPLNPPHPHSPQPAHRLTHPHLSNPICPLCTPTYHRASIQLYTLIYPKQHTGPLDVPGRVVPLLARWKGRLARPP